jgi:hypothetical protein
MNTRKIWFGVVACLLAGCGGGEVETGGGAADDSTEVIRGAVSSARADFGPSVPADRCNWTLTPGVSAGYNAAGQRYLQYKPPVGGQNVAIMQCPLPGMLPGTPWDTAMLTRMTYEYVGLDKGPLVGRIMLKQNGVTKAMSTPVASVYGATAVTYTYWVGSTTPSVYTYEADFYLPAGIRFYTYSYSYFDLF